MRRWVIALTMLLVLVAVPFAMAADGCVGMGTVCGASCSAPCTSVSAPISDLPLVSVGTSTPLAVQRVPVPALKTLDAPPKSALSA
jgi:hypothetical protein